MTPTSSASLSVKTDPFESPEERDSTRAPGTSEAAIRFDRVSKRYKNGRLALNSVSFSIPFGSRTCLLGPNGAGKTTAIRLLQGLIRPTAGEVGLLGTNLSSPRYFEARRRTGIVPQNPGMYPDLTVSEYLEFAQRIYARGQVQRVVELFSLGEHLRTELASLSGGFQRRVVLAAALIAEPELLLLDEPTAGLDPLAAHQVRQFLKESLPGRTVLLCTHDLAEAEMLTEDVLILRGGRVVIHQPIRSLADAAVSLVRLAVRQSAPDLARAMREAGYTADPVGEHAVVVSLREPEREAADVLRRMLAAGFDIYECVVVGPNLKDAFLERMAQ